MSLLPLLLPTFCLLLTLLLAARRSRLGLASSREALLAGATGTAVWAVAGTEVLSLVGELRFPWILGWWLLGIALLLPMLFRFRRGLRGWVDRGGDRDAVVWIFGGICAVVLLCAFLVGVLSPPNTYDVQTYHLPRQYYWLQQQSVAPYPTTDSRQLLMPPLAEFLGMHTLALSGTVFWINLVQWSALALSALAVSLIVRELGGGGRAQSFAALLVVANPMAYVQSSSGKNDLVVTLFLLLLVLCMVRIVRSRACSVALACAVGTVLGLLLLTKGTGYVFALVPSLVIGAALLVARRLRAVPIGTLMVVVSLLLNAGHMARTYAVTGWILPPEKISEGGWELRNEARSPALVASNLVRNLALHLGTSDHEWNDRLTRAVVALHDGLGWDPHDPRITRYGDFRVLPTFVNESNAAAPVHVVAFVLAVGVSLSLRRLRAAHAAWIVAAVALAGFVLFCALLKWQPWHARLHTPIVSLTAPFVALALADRGRWWLGLLLVPLLLLPLGATAVGNSARPLAGPRSVLTSDRYSMWAPRNPVVDDERRAVLAMLGRAQPDAVGIRLWPEGEGPFQTMLREAVSTDVRFVSQTAEPRWPALRRNDVPDPDFLILNHDGPAWGIPSGTVYSRIARLSTHAVFAPADAPRSLFPRGPFHGTFDAEGLGDVTHLARSRADRFVRIATAPEITIPYSAQAPARLIVELRGNGARQSLSVLLDAEPIAALELQHVNAFETFEITLPSSPSQRVLTLLRTAPDGSPLPPAVFRRLQILHARPADPVAPNPGSQ